MPNNWGLTQEEIAEIQENGPEEISLYINGREFPLDGITLEGTTTLFDALIRQRDELAELMEHHLATHARSLEMTLPEARQFLGEQGLFLDKMIAELTRSTS